MLECPCPTPWVMNDTSGTPKHVLEERRGGGEGLEPKSLCTKMAQISISFVHFIFPHNGGVFAQPGTVRAQRQLLR